MGLSNLPPGLTPAHPHFNQAEWPDTCPDCGIETYDEPYCVSCGAVLDPDEAAAIARDEAYELMADREAGR